MFFKKREVRSERLDLIPVGFRNKRQESRNKMWKRLWELENEICSLRQAQCRCYDMLSTSTRYKWIYAHYDRLSAGSVNYWGV